MVSSFKVYKPTRITPIERTTRIPNSTNAILLAASVPVTEAPREANLMINLVNTPVNTPAKRSPFATNFDFLIMRIPRIANRAPTAMPKKMDVLV